MIEQFGRSIEGDPVHRVRISGGGLEAYLLTRGAALQDLRLAGHEPSLVLGLNSFEDYEAHGGYLGATIGRFANRISNAGFTLDGTHYDIDNTGDGMTLHGGKQGFSHRNWSLSRHGDNFAVFSLNSVDGDMGFPGALKTHCTYRLEQGGRLVVELEATCDAPTICSLTHHSYFNLEDGGRSSVYDHEVCIKADTYLPVNEKQIPLGAPKIVTHTDFDFRQRKSIGPSIGYDHNFCLSHRRQDLRHVACVFAPKSGIEMHLETTEPGLQFYSGKTFECAQVGLDGICYNASAGFCFEPQVWPDAPNQDNYPSALLLPNQKYHHHTVYRFKKHL